MILGQAEDAQSTLFDFVGVRIVKPGRCNLAERHRACPPSQGAMLGGVSPCGKGGSAVWALKGRISMPTESERSC